ncbi:methyltransferase domain-containing protein [Rhizobium gallicum]|uniref:site-specific DNA-methyltransferase (adenine-specific) n=1 Tax=Rhizobium gallicum TaxID=56730 RepID=A0A1L5NMC1_9HYPH|nr:methyltransferase domain-containing protein [Rhizobium gallicum]
MDILKFQITSRREFERLKSCDSATLTDLERADRFIYLQKPAFGGKVEGQNFGVETTGRARFNLTRLARLLEDVHERLAGVAIENLDWLYLDPPYFGSEGDYGKTLFGREQFEVTAEPSVASKATPFCPATTFRRSAMYSALPSQKRN